MTTVLNKPWEKIVGLRDIVYHKAILINGVSTDRILITHSPQSKSTTFCNTVNGVSITISGKTFEELTLQFETDVLVLLLGGPDDQIGR